MRAECIREKIVIDGKTRVRGEVFDLSPLSAELCLDLLDKALIKLVSDEEISIDKHGNRKLEIFNKKES